MVRDSGGAAHLLDHMPAIATAVSGLQYQRMPELHSRYGERGRAHCHADALFHLRFLAQAVRLSAPQLFTDYAGWAKIMLASRGVPPEDLKANLTLLAECAVDGAAEDAAREIRGVIEHTLAQYDSLPETIAMLLDGSESDSVTGRYLAPFSAGIAGKR